MMNTDNKRSIKDALGQIIHEGDRVVFCHRGWCGKDAILQPGTVMRITDYGVWTKPDDPTFGHEYSDKHYDSVAHKFIATKYYAHNGWKWSHSHLVVKLGS